MRNLEPNVLGRGETPGASSDFVLGNAYVRCSYEIIHLFQHYYATCQHFNFQLALIIVGFPATLYKSRPLVCIRYLPSTILR